ncbi:SET domain-containing protein 5 [Cladobotryum mycophilum]|uniref:SET domain-containing protein 5 n=1 Tax=Cladobotryum mycophilum TaxID=491253 RepID=A0ABR0SN55_9HYPO
MESKFEITTSCNNTANKAEETHEISSSPSKELVKSVGRPFVIREIVGKGRGLVATTKIDKGTRILSEAPIFTVPRNNPDIEALERIVENKVKCLNEDQQRTFFDLTNIYGNVHSQSLGISRTNVLPLGSKANCGGLFLETSRINHSCRHNAQNTWNENLQRLTIHALRDIEEGQEITITYLASTSTYAERHHFLKEKFGFDCKCELCSLPQAEKKCSDARLSKLQVLDSLIGALLWDDSEPEQALHLLHMMLGLFNEEGIWDGTIARAYNDAYEIAIQNGDEPRAAIFAERAYDVRRLIEGDDSSVTMKMKRAVETLPTHTPQGMDEAEFENWLWMLSETSEDSDYIGSDDY